MVPANIRNDESCAVSVGDPLLSNVCDSDSCTCTSCANDNSLLINFRGCINPRKFFNRKLLNLRYTDAFSQADKTTGDSLATSILLNGDDIVECASKKLNPTIKC